MLPAVDQNVVVILSTKNSADIIVIDSHLLNAEAAFTATVNSTRATQL